MEPVIYNGVDLTENFIVAGIKRPLPSATPELKEVPGGDRRFVRDIEFTPPELSFIVIAPNLDEEGKRDSARLLASILLVKEPVEVAFDSDCCLRYKVVPSGNLDFNEYVRCGSMMVTLQCVEAAMYGDTHTANGAAGGTATIYVGGSYKTMLNIEATSATRQSANDPLYGVRLDEGDYAYVEMPVQTCGVSIDGENREIVVNESHAQLTLESDWFEVEPGIHTVRNDKGSGAFTVTWTERWL